MMQNKLAALKVLVGQLDASISDNRAKDFLVRPASAWLHDVETVLLPNAIKSPLPAHVLMWLEMAEVQLEQAQKQLASAQELVGIYKAKAVANGL